jgi:beta-glucosidase-like glycosyl hydrolase
VCNHRPLAHRDLVHFAVLRADNAETYGEGIFGNGSASQFGAIPSCANKGILNDLARDKWGFDGYITSDCGAVGNVQNQHHYTNDSKSTVQAVLAVGNHVSVAVGAKMNSFVPFCTVIHSPSRTLSIS